MKTKKSIFAFIAFNFLLVSCEKETTDDVSGMKEINGKIFIQNVYEGEAKTPLGSVPLYLKKDTSSGTNSYLFSTVSDSSGFFKFQYLRDQPYNIYSGVRKNTLYNTNILFTRNLRSEPSDNIEIILTPDFESQNALFITCRDTSISHDPIPQTKIFIYNNRIIAAADTTGIMSGTNSIHQFISQNDGTVFKLNLPFTGKLYINAEKTIGTKVYKAKLIEVQLASAGLFPLDIFLSE